MRERGGGVPRQMPVTQKGRGEDPSVFVVDSARHFTFWLGLRFSHREFGQVRFTRI